MKPVVSLIFPVAAKTCYVAPWATIAQAVAQAGDTVYFRGGTYSYSRANKACASGTDRVDAITLSKSGSSGFTNHPDFTMLSVNSAGVAVGMGNLRNNIAYPGTLTSNMSGTNASYNSRNPGVTLRQSRLNGGVAGVSRARQRVATSRMTHSGPPRSRMSHSRPRRQPETGRYGTSRTDHGLRQPHGRHREPCRQRHDFAGALPRQADGSLPVLPNLRLAAGSALIDKGTTVGLPYNGKAPDLGAFES